MLPKSTPHLSLQIGVPVSGLLYPDRCLQCPEMLSEVYGCVKSLRCVDCIAAEIARTRLAVLTWNF